MKAILVMIAVCGGVPAIAAAAPPQVVKTVPENNAQNVDPALSEIRVTFDQDMNPGGYSWVGGGPMFPKTRGRPRWVDACTPGGL